ncbi:MAG: hypothetical protein KME40_10050 [Komarekiella atlantica HA4396-MV6]|nr:hypothetical protein [Komarekiella atlantica HA4396-MV6]
MASIKITNLQPLNQVEEQKLSNAELTAVSGGIKFQLLGNNYVDATFGGFRLTL